MMGCVVLAVLLLMSSAGFAFSGGHSHRFYSTLTYNSSFGFSLYSSTRTIDDITLFGFNSDDGVIERRVPWFKAANKSLLKASLSEHLFHGVMHNLTFAIMHYLNDMEGQHILQNIDGCTLLPNGTVHLIINYHYDAKPLMFYDWDTRKYRAELPEFEDLVEKLSENLTASEEAKDKCEPHIKELLALGKSTFNRKEPPVVKVIQIPIDNITFRVSCQAYDHYPKEIFIMWYMNGQQMSEEIMERLILPIPGLTYLTSLSFNVTSMADDVYTCRVNHSSMQRDFTQNWRISGDYESLSNPPSDLPIGAVIAICLAVILIIVFMVFGSVALARSKRQ
ncbi:patr class I histocompatibility antigen, CH28 alpha chain-like [Eleutherodactylus coqui]|uniref:patr class I histocompatibility antigen, CH28 alpha chain-like n=1 Tax=Eleutherodactylus coqui TaxID=57060 RepID=UPI0034634CA3